MSRTATSTLRLSEYARAFVYPDGITKTVWPKVEKKGQELGLGFDWWQRQLGAVCLGYRDDGRYACTVGGIGMSIPRQVGKTYFVLAVLLILCIMFPGLQVVWTAHHLRTSTKTYTKLRGMAKRKKIAPHIKAIRSANGEQEVVFTNGSIIMFGARSRGFGRGFDEIDIEVFDEAQILDSKALDDMVAATNQARHEHGALLFFMGTPPRETDPSEAFRLRRQEALAGETDNAVWLEIGADPESDPDDRGQWPMMNPSFPLRTPAESIERLRKNLGDPDSWNREGRGIWDPDKVGGALPYAKWLELEDASAERGLRPVFGVDVAEDRSAWISVAWQRPDGATQVMLANPDQEPLTPDQVLIETIRMAKTWHGTVVAPKWMVDDFHQLGMRVTPTTLSDFTVGSGLFADAVKNGVVHHGNQYRLNDAVKASRWRSAGATGERAIQLNGHPEVGPLASAIRAFHGLKTKRPAAPMAARV